MEHPDTLGPKVHYLWEALGNLGPHYILIGGTAIAYRLGHRVSYDLDIVTSHPLEHPRVLRRRLGGVEVGKHKWVRRHPDHYVKFFETASAPKVDFHGKDPRPCIETPVLASNGLRLASLTDLMYQKCIAMASRTQQRDAQDVTALMAHPQCNVDQALSALTAPAPVGLDPDELLVLQNKLKQPQRAGWPACPPLATLGRRIAHLSPQPLRTAAMRIEGGEKIAQLSPGEQEPADAHQPSASQP